MLDIKLFNILREIDKGKNVTAEYCAEGNFKYRLKIQKILYILTHGTENRITLPYRWTFYIRGPYSSEIAHMIYHLNDYSDEARKLADSRPLDTAEKKVIGRFLELEKFLNKNAEKLEGKIKTEEIYELAGTAMYIGISIMENEENIGWAEVKKGIAANIRNLKPELADRLDTDLENFIDKLAEKMRETGFLTPD